MSSAAAVAMRGAYSHAARTVVSGCDALCVDANTRSADSCFTHSTLRASSSAPLLCECASPCAVDALQPIARVV
jgi:hypothetical protein